MVIKPTLIDDTGDTPETTNGTARILARVETAENVVADDDEDDKKEEDQGQGPKDTEGDDDGKE